MSKLGLRPASIGHAEGEQFSDLATAKRVAIERVRRLLNAEAASGQLNLDRKVEIIDEAGEVLAVISFREIAGW